jgi:hypothetical protein
MPKPLIKNKTTQQSDSISGDIPADESIFELESRSRAATPANVSTDDDAAMAVILEIISELKSDPDASPNNLISHLKSLHWMRNLKYHTNKLQHAKELSSEKRHRSQTVDLILEWVNSSTSKDHQLAGLCMVLYLNRDKKILRSALEQLYHTSIDPIIASNFGIDSLTFYIRANLKNMETFFGPRCHLLIFATGVLRNMAEHTYNRLLLAEHGIVEHLSILLWTMTQV